MNSGGGFRRKNKPKATIWHERVRARKKNERNETAVSEGERQQKYAGKEERVGRGEKKNAKTKRLRNVAKATLAHSQKRKNNI